MKNSIRNIIRTIILSVIVFFTFTSSMLFAWSIDRYGTPRRLYYTDIVGELHGIDPAKVPPALIDTLRRELHDKIIHSTPEELSQPVRLTPKQMAEEFISMRPIEEDLIIMISGERIAEEIEVKVIQRRIADLVKEVFLEMEKRGILQEGLVTPIQTYLIVPADEEETEEVKTEEEMKEKKEIDILPIVVRLFEGKLIIENMKQEEIEVFINHLKRLRGVSLSEIQPGIYELKIPGL